jgi:uncharacterized protein (TIGR02217 family)
LTAPYLPTRWLITTPDTADDPDVLPRMIGQSFLMSKRPTWSTAITTARSGRERRRQNWSYPIWQFKLHYEVLRDRPAAPDLARLTAFFNMHAGRQRQFLFLDPTDNAVTNQPFATGDGVSRTFQLTRAMAVGAIAFAEPIAAVQGPPTVFVNGAAASGFTIGAFGAITFAAAPAAGAVLSWSGRFLFACRFDQDDLDTQQMMAALWTQDGLAFRTVKP